MKVTILDDWFDTIRHLPSFAKLDAHEVTIWNDHVEDTDLLAERLADAEVVSLVDRDRQWFKSCVGLDRRESSRELAFCAHAILEVEPLIVPDTLQDPRFADNPLVTEGLHIRFYAGCPLKSSNGHALGTLCLVDTQPRAFGRRQINLLKDLSDLVERELAAEKP